MAGADGEEAAGAADGGLARTNEKLCARVKQLAAHVQQLQHQPETESTATQTNRDSKVTGLSTCGQRGCTATCARAAAGRAEGETEARWAACRLHLSPSLWHTAQP